MRDRILVRIVLFAFQDCIASQTWSIFTKQDSEKVTLLARKVRASWILTSTESGSLRMLPFLNVWNFKKELESIGAMNVPANKCYSDNRTMEKRIEVVLASNGIIIKNITDKLRCNVSTSIAEKILCSIFVTTASRKLVPARLSIENVRSMLKAVNGNFITSQEKYW